MPSRIYDYRRPLRRDEVRVDLVIDEHAGRDSLAGMVTAAGDRFGFTTVTARAAEPDVLADADQGRALRHLIVVADREFDYRLVEVIRSLLATTYHGADLVLAYPTPESSARALAAIKPVKTELADRLNFPRPDGVDARGWLAVSDDKVTEESISNTVRIKYRPDRVAPHTPAGWAASVLPFFRAAADAYCRNEMHHRSRSDGYLAVRTPDGLAITATKTYKDRIGADRIVLVHGYDEATNTLSYSGSALPSQEAVELSIVVGKQPSLRSFVHTHASTLFVRNPRFVGRMRIGRVPSGLPETGHELAQALDGYQRGFVIMEEHGELFFHTSADAGPIIDVIDSACKAVLAGDELPEGLLVH